MSITFMDYPKYVTPDAYEIAIQNVLREIVKHSNPLAIYQIGGVSNPGISDIDLVVVFEDGDNYKGKPLKGCNDIERYLFVHALFGVTRNQYVLARVYSFFHNYQLVSGKDIPVPDFMDLSSQDIDILKRQIALEFLLRFYISSTVEVTYRMFKVRSFLLQAKAIRYDMEFLGVEAGTFGVYIDELVEMRNNWFSGKVPRTISEKWVISFYKEMKRFVEKAFSQFTFFLPEPFNRNISKNIELCPAECMGYSHKGILLSEMIRFPSRKYFNLQHRLNRFVFHIPNMSHQLPRVLRKRFRLLKEMKESNMVAFPHFMSMATGLNII